MAFFQCHFFSEVLGMSVSMNAILPQKSGCLTDIDLKTDPAPPVLYLLHGLSDDHTAWTRRTAIELYAAPYGLSVIMPGAGRSFYADMHSGAKYWTFLTEELPATARHFFNVSSRPEDTYVAGISMGGYAAFKWALHYPERFRAAASLSGCLDLAGRMADTNVLNAAEINSIFSDRGQIQGSGNDLFHLLKKRVSEKTALPALYMTCGRDDFLYDDNIAFRHFAEKNTIDLTYDEAAGAHDWTYWDRKIRQVLNWFPGLERSA